MLVYRLLKKTKKRTKYVFSIIFLFLSYLFLTYGYAIALQALNAKKKGQFILAIFVVCSFVFFVPLLEYLSSVWRIRINNEVVSEVRIQMFKKMIEISGEKYLKNGQEFYMSNLVNNISILEKRLIDNFYNIIIYAITVITCLSIIFCFDKILFLFLLFVVIVLYFGMEVFGKKLSEQQVNIAKEKEKNVGFLDDFFGGMREIKNYNSVQFFTNKLKNRIGIESKEEERYTWFLSCEGMISRTIIHCILAISMAYLAYKISEGDSLAIVVFLYNQLNLSLMYFIRIPPVLSQMKGANRVYENALKELECVDEGIQKYSFEKTLKLQNVSVAYGDVLVLDNVNLSIEKGKKYLLVGPSGSGKSTLVKIIAGLILNYSGKYLVDNIDSREINKKDMFQHVAWISQQVFLFQSSLRDNLTLFSLVEEERLNDAVSYWGLDNIRGKKSISELLDVAIEEDGNNLSGGQKQKVALARAFLRNAEIVLLDESLAHIDKETADELERKVLAQECTLIHISHRVFTKDNPGYDAIITMDGKRVNVKDFE